MTRWRLHENSFSDSRRWSGFSYHISSYSGIIMKIILWILLLAFSVEAGLPRWLPASQGALLDESQERAEMDKKLAEFDKNFLAVTAIA
jgi:hypothetical protein